MSGLPIGEDVARAYLAEPGADASHPPRAEEIGALKLREENLRGKLEAMLARGADGWGPDHRHTLDGIGRHAARLVVQEVLALLAEPGEGGAVRDFTWPVLDESDDAQAFVQSVVLDWLFNHYYSRDSADDLEVSVAPEGDGHWVFDVFEGDANEVPASGMGYVHPNGHIEGLY